MLINHSNHPSTKWSAEQVAGCRAYAAELTGKDASTCPLIDEPFPAIDPDWDEAEVQGLAAEWICTHRERFPEIIAVHLMGETSYVCQLTSMLGLWGIPVLCSTTRREVIDHADGRKESVFRFVRMRRIN